MITNVITNIFKNLIYDIPDSKAMCLSHSLSLFFLTEENYMTRVLSHTSKVQVQYILVQCIHLRIGVHILKVSKKRS